MKIKKRDGRLEQLSFDKIIYRLKKICNDKVLRPLKSIDPDIVAQKVVSSIYDGVTSCELDEEAARIAVSMIDNLQYQKLASRIIISNAHKNTHECFSEVMERLYNNTDKLGKHAPILADDIIEIIRKHKNTLNFAIDYNRDYLFDYFGYKTLERSYLQKIWNVKNERMEIVERPQHLYMRVAVGIHKDDIESVLKTYHLISQHYYTHATPTLFNAGTRLASLASCYLIGSEDSIEGIFKTITDCGKISKLAGGIGVHITNIRAKGSMIRGTNGLSDGIIPMIKVYNETARYINQGGKRKGSFALYLETWHADILEFLDLKKNQGHEDMRARDLFYAMWISDLFMKCVEEDSDWYLMCPDECPGLSDTYGEDFEKLYNKYVTERRYKRVVKAQEIWRKILDAQIETGTPYICYKDAVNKKCNQKNLGTIKSSNLCAEINLYSDDKEYAVCNLASIALPKFVKYDHNNKPYFDFEHLRQISEYIIHPMNKVIDHTYYPVPETKLSNMKNRPVGLGIQGLVDVYVKMRLPFESEAAKKLNKEIFETIYYGSLRGSIELAKRDGAYSSFQGSPFSEGKLQFDLAAEYDGIDLTNYLSGRWDWDSLKQDLVKYGSRNSMLLALMPTASTAQIMGNSECFEPVDSCIFKRRVLSGEFIVVNKYLVEDLEKLNLWNNELKDMIIANDGSIQNIDIIPDDIKQLYKTVWEISMKSVIEQCHDRGVFIDQTMSMNLFMANPNYKRLTSMHFYAWKKNLKTGMYYLRSKSSASAGKFSINPELEKRIREKKERGEQLEQEEQAAILACSLENKEDCMMCSS
jgi:ribonucleoside-diphosphate reductase alpha chain